MDAIPWEWVGVAGGILCAALCGLTALIGVGVLIWRLSRKADPQATPACEAEGPETDRMLTTVLGYRRGEDRVRSRERWGRPLQFHRDPQQGASWSTPVEGETLLITEREGRPGGVPTGDASLDQRFHVEVSRPELAALLAEPELRDRLLALPFAHIESDGTAISFRDHTLRAHQRACTPHAPESPDGLAMQVRLHDSVSDVLVMLADRLG